jgi:hypothetical protein
MYLFWTLVLTADFSVHLVRLTDFDCRLFLSPNLDFNYQYFNLKWGSRWVWPISRGCSLLPTLAFVEGSYCPTLDFVIAFYTLFYFAIWYLCGDVTIIGKGLQNLGPGPLSREGSLSCHTYCDTGLHFSGLIRRAAHSVASYDPKGDVEDLF